MKINKKIYLLILIIFESIIVVNCIYTWNGLISILPTIGSIIRTYCLWQTNMKLVRISGVTTGILYGLYYSYYHSWFIVMGDIILLLTSIINIYKNDIKNRKEEKNEKSNCTGYGDDHGIESQPAAKHLARIYEPCKGYIHTHDTCGPYPL